MVSEAGSLDKIAGETVDEELWAVCEIQEFLVLMVGELLLLIRTVFDWVASGDLVTRQCDHDFGVVWTEQSEVELCWPQGGVCDMAHRVLVWEEVDFVVEAVDDSREVDTPD